MRCCAALARQIPAEAAAHLIHEESPSCHVQCLRYPLQSENDCAAARDTDRETPESGSHRSWWRPWRAAPVAWDTKSLSRFPRFQSFRTRVRQRCCGSHAMSARTCSRSTAFSRRTRRLCSKNWLRRQQYPARGLAIKVLGGTPADRRIDRWHPARRVGPACPDSWRGPQDGRTHGARTPRQAATGRQPGRSGLQPPLPSISSSEDVMSALLNLGCARPAAESRGAKGPRGGSSC